MTVQHVTEEDLNAFLDGECSDQDRIRVEEHLAACADCARTLGELSAVKQMLGAMDVVELPRSFTLPAKAPLQVPLASPAPVGAGHSNLRRFEPMARVLSIAAVLAFLLLGGGQMAGWIGNESTSPGDSALNSETDAPASALQEEEPALARGELREQGDSAATGAGTLTSQPARVDTPAQVDHGLTPLELTTVGIGVIALLAIAGWILIHYRTGTAS